MSRKRDRQLQRSKEHRDEVATAAPSISVIVPTWNRPSSLRAVLRGWAEQTLPRPRYEVVVVQSGFDAETTTVLREFAESKIAFRVFHLEENRGPALARNLGVGRARAPIVLFSSDDAVPTPTLLAEHLEAHRENPHPSIGVLGHVVLSDAPSSFDRFIEQRAYRYAYPRITDPTNVGYRFFYANNLSLKRAFLLQQDLLFDPTLAPECADGVDELDLGYRLECAGMRLIDRPTAVSGHLRRWALDDFCRRLLRVGRLTPSLVARHPKLAEILPDQSTPTDGGIDHARLHAELEKVQGAIGEIDKANLDLLNPVAWKGQSIGAMLSEAREKLYEYACDSFYRAGLAEAAGVGQGPSREVPGASGVDAPVPSTVPVDEAGTAPATAIEYSVVIVTFNSGDEIENCLLTIEKSNRSERYEVIVVDNASADDTTARVTAFARNHPTVPITLVANERNTGYSFAANQGTAQSKGAYVVYLNPDTYVSTHWLPRMAAHFAPDVGAVGPVSDRAAMLHRFELYYKGTIPQSATVDQVSETMYRQNAGRGVETKLLIGFCMMVPRRILDEIGTFDEDLFLGNDDLDYSWRLRLRGYRLVVATDVFIHHINHASFNSLSEEVARHLPEQSKERFIAKLRRYYGPGQVPTSRELFGVPWLDEEAPTGETVAPRKRPKLVAMLVVKNEEKYIAETLARASEYVDEIVILDDGSTDSTVEICRRYPKVVDLQVQNVPFHEGRSRNRLLDMAMARHPDWLLALDADEVFDDVIHDQIESLLSETDPNVKAYMVPIYHFWRGRDAFRVDPPWGGQWRIKFLRAEQGIRLANYEFHVPNLPVTFRDSDVKKIPLRLKHFGYSDFDDCVRRYEFYSRVDRVKDPALIGSTDYRHLIDESTLLLKKWVDEETDQTNLPDATAYRQSPGVIPPRREAPLPAHASSKVPVVSIVILAHNQLEFSRQCIESIRRYTADLYEMILVDNGSIDGTTDYFRTIPGARLIVNATNRGFAGGCNQGVVIARGEYVLLLNNDTVVTDGWLFRLLRAARADESIGLVGPRSNNVVGEQRVPSVSYQNVDEMHAFAAEFARAHRAQITLTRRVIGFCMLIKRSVIEKIGGLDERFGSGNFEDDDYCVRAMIAGFRIAVAEDAFVHHYGQRTFSGVGIDYDRAIQKNWETFRQKWQLSPEIDLLKNGYPIAELQSRDFESSLHVCPLPTDVPYTVIPEAQAAAVTTASAFDPDEQAGRALLAEGQRLLQAGKLVEARESLDQALKHQPDLVSAQYLLGVALLQLGEIPAAVDRLRRTVAMEPRVADFRNALGAAHEEAGDPAAAEAAYRQALQLDSGSMAATRNLADLLVKRDCPADAVPLYERLLAANRDDADVRARLEDAKGAMRNRV